MQNLIELGTKHDKEIFLNILNSRNILMYLKADKKICPTDIENYPYINYFDELLYEEYL